MFLITHAPYRTDQNAAALDMLLAAGSTQYNAIAVFTNNGIFTLLKEQQASALQATDLNKMWHALAVYNIEQVYTLKNSLQQRNITADQLILGTQPIATNELAKLMSQQDFILRF